MAGWGWCWSTDRIVVDLTPSMPWRWGWGCSSGWRSGWCLLAELGASDMQRPGLRLGWWPGVGEKILGLCSGWGSGWSSDLSRV
jgi:hypothetical protein